MGVEWVGAGAHTLWHITLWSIVHFISSRVESVEVEKPDGSVVTYPVGFIETQMDFLQCDRENREDLKYLRNVYCLMTNHSKDQDTRTGHKTCLRFSFLMADWLFLAMQQHSRNIFGVHGFPGFTVIKYHVLTKEWRTENFSLTSVTSIKRFHSAKPWFLWQDYWYSPVLLPFK